MPLLIPTPHQRFASSLTRYHNRGECRRIAQRKNLLAQSLGSDLDAEMWSRAAAGRSVLTLRGILHRIRNLPRQKLDDGAGWNPQLPRECLGAGRSSHAPGMAHV